MDGKTLARIAAAMFAGVAITATVIELTREDETPPSAPRQTLRPSAPDPLREDQRRCQRLGEAAARDDGCLRVWAETRDRFLGRTSPSAPSSEAR